MRHTVIHPFLCCTLFTLAAVFIPIDTAAQILNIERHRLKEDSTKTFLMNAKLGMTLNNRSAAETEPVELFGFNSSINAIYRTEHHGYILVGQTDYLRINESTFLNFGFAHFRINFLRKRKINYEAFTQASYDNFRGLDPRLVLGGSVRMKVHESERSDVIFGLGGFYESEKWLNPITDQFVEVEFLKVSTYVSFRQEIAENVDFNAVVYYQTGYDRGIEDYRHRVSGNVNLNTRITKKLSFNNSFEWSYEDKPIVPITKFIYALRMGLLLSI